MRGIILQLCASVKKLRTQKLNHLLKEIHNLETQHKIFPSQQLSLTISLLRYDYPRLLCERHDNYARTLKCNNYAHGNKARKHLAPRDMIQRPKTKITHLIYPKDNHNILNPQDIGNSFADYYSSLHNLCNDTNTPQSIT